MATILARGICFQPLVSLWGYPAKFEVLAGNVQAVLDLTPPERFEYDLHVLERGLYQMWRWQSEFPGLGLSWNIEPEALKQPDCADRIIAVHRQSGLPPHQLTIEITEGQPLDLADPTVLRNLRKLAVEQSGTNRPKPRFNLALDDLGSGHFANFVQVQALIAELRQRDIHLSVIKLDRALVEKIGTDAGRAQIEAFVRLAHKYGIVTVAEGVNHDDHLAATIQIGCHQFQSFRLGGKMSAAQCRAWLRRRRRRSRPLSVLLSQHHTRSRV
jgi:EAL domain-containing protein (putative c-di-GMP-specific phosphodiesterase class I)